MTPPVSPLRRPVRQQPVEDPLTPPSVIRQLWDEVNKVEYDDLFDNTQSRTTARQRYELSLSKLKIPEAELRDIIDKIFGVIDDLIWLLNNRR